MNYFNFTARMFEFDQLPCTRSTPPKHKKNIYKINQVPGENHHVMKNSTKNRKKREREEPKQIWKKPDRMVANENESFTMI